MRWICPLLVVLGVTSCGGQSAARGAPAGTQLATAFPAPHYAALFEQGRVFHYAVVRHAEEGDAESGTKVDDTDAASCKVQRVNERSGVLVSTIVCDGALERVRVEQAVPVAGSFVSGVWIATREGLWKAEGDTDHALREARPSQAMIIAARPEPKREKSQAESAESGEELAVELRGDTWCATRSRWSGDQDAAQFCFRAGDGLVSGSRQFRGGYFVELRFEVEPPDGARAHGAAERL